MPKEYRTIQEVAGPLMLVHGVEGVTYDELGEIELASGETRRCKVLEVNGSDVLVQLFESSTGINLSNSKVRFLDEAWNLAYQKICLDASLTDLVIQSMKVRRFFRMPEWTSMVFR